MKQDTLHQYRDSLLKVHLKLTCMHSNGTIPKCSLAGVYNSAVDTSSSAFLSAEDMDTLNITSTAPAPTF